MLFCRYEDVSTVMVRNSHLDLMDQDILYHLALGSGSHDLRAMFGDVKVKLYAVFNTTSICVLVFLFRKKYYIRVLNFNSINL